MFLKSIMDEEDQEVSYQFMLAAEMLIDKLICWIFIDCSLTSAQINMKVNNKSSLLKLFYTKHCTGASCTQHAEQHKACRASVPEEQN